MEPKNTASSIENAAEDALDARNLSNTLESVLSDLEGLAATLFLLSETMTTETASQACYFLGKHLDPAITSITDINEQVLHGIASSRLPK